MEFFLPFSVREWWRQRRLPEVVRGGDYRFQIAVPDQLIDGEGRYRPGWWTSSPGSLNLEASTASKRRLHRWFFVHFDAGPFFVGFNIIDLGIGGNTGVVVLDKRSGAFSVRSSTRLFHRNGVEIDSECRNFSERRSQSFLRIDTDDRIVDFDVRADGYRVVGQARALFAHPFVQCTAFHEGHGTLQTWGNLVLESGEVEYDGKRVELPVGTYGGYDRSFGHRRPLENWNWLVAVGPCRRESDGQIFPFAMHVAHDRPRARPQVDGQKYALWVGDLFGKLQDLKFDYQVLDPRERRTSNWRITSSSGKMSVDLIFEPSFKRHDAHRFPFVFHVDHLQYFGKLAGTIWAGGERFLVEDVFASAEDSRMMI